MSAGLSDHGLGRTIFQPAFGPLPGWPASSMTIRASRTRFVWTPILGWVLLSCAAPAVRAQVDTPSPARQTLDQQTPQVDLPTDASTSGGATNIGDELGIGVGAFTLHPTLELNLGYDDNVFATPAPTTPSAIAVDSAVARAAFGLGKAPAAAAGQRRFWLLRQRADPELPELYDPG